MSPMGAFGLFIGDLITAYLCQVGRLQQLGAKITPLAVVLMLLPFILCYAAIWGTGTYRKRATSDRRVLLISNASRLSHANKHVIFKHASSRK